MKLLKTTLTPARPNIAIPTAGLLAVMAFVLMAGCSGGGGTYQQPPVPVVVAPAVTKTIPFEVSSIGNVEAYRTVSVRSQVGGVLKRILFKEGEHVQKGELLLLIDPAPFRAALEAARATLARDQVTAANLQQTVKRYDDLTKKNYITEQQRADMVTQAASMMATVRADSAAVLTATLNLEYCSIRSPIDGRIGEQLVDEGNVVKANSDNPLVVINQIEPVFVRFTVPERYLTEILRVSASDTLTVRVSAPEDPSDAHTGRLTFIDNAVDMSTGTITLKAEVANHDALLWPGEFVNVKLVLKELESAVVVPSQAVGTGQQGDYVFVVKEDQTVDLRPVTVNYRLDNDAVIDRGVDPGETVVIDGQLRLRPGSKIVVKEPVEPDKKGTS
jgi:multidrug efflux system membrane fusion protein